MNITDKKKLLLHACCGPCSLEPIRLLRERGIEPVIYFANSNIAPEDEYIKRQDTLIEWAKNEGIEVVEEPYDNKSWLKDIGEDAHITDDDEQRRNRCRKCYRNRFKSSVAYAQDHNFDLLGTTLSVSPYQFQDIIEEELINACKNSNVEPFFEDYSPYYRDATKKSRNLGMYRQNYCGCLSSYSEAERDRKNAKIAREEKKMERAKLRQSQEKELDKKRKERAEYDKKQAQKRKILKSLRQKETI